MSGITLLFLITSLATSNEIDFYTFKSPLIPTHADKFTTMGQAIPMRKYTRLHPPKPDAGGSIQTSTPIHLSTFEIEVVINVGGSAENEDVGASLWFTNSTSLLSNLYGLNADFSGIAVILDVNKSSVYVLENYEILTIEKIFTATQCSLEMKNRQIALHLHMKEGKFEVWIKGKRTKKCAEIKIRNIDMPVFGVSAYSGASSNSVFDIVQIVTQELEDEEAENRQMDLLEKKLEEQVIELDEKLQGVLTNLQALTQKQEFLEIIQKIKGFQERTSQISNRLVNLWQKLSVVHIEDTFTEKVNAEVIDLGETFEVAQKKIDSLMEYMDSKEVISQVYTIVEAQYKSSSNKGKKLIKDFDEADKTFDSFEISFEADNRLTYVHFGLILSLLSITLLCCKIWSIQKVRILTE